MKPAETGGSLSLMEVLCSDEDMFEQAHLRSQTRQLVSILNQTLDQRELQIISWRYGLYGGKPMAQREVADQLGISRSYVSRLEKRALGKLREAMEQPQT